MPDLVKYATYVTPEVRDHLESEEPDFAQKVLFQIVKDAET